MKTTAEFLNEIKIKYNLKSNYALAKLMQQTETSISRWIHGRTTLSDESALQVADLLEIDPAYVVACVHAERASDKTRKIWERMATLTAGLAALVILSVAVPTAGHESALFAAFTRPSMYIMSNSIFDYWPVFMALFIIIFLARPRNIASKK